MPWYSYLFFLLAALAFIGGGTSQAQRGNVAGMIQVVLLTIMWTSLGLWTGGFLS